jgi:Tol biopolymer transport system component
MKRLLLILSLVVVVGATTGAGVRSATAVDRAASNADGAIVFESNRDGDYDIYGMNLDGTGLTQLTKDPLDEGNPLPSPDGRRILLYGGAGGDGLEVMNADGSDPRSFDYCTFGAGAWSPDSRHVVCSDYGEEGERILILDTADGTTTELTSSGSRPSWSPDGTTIAYHDEYKLYVVPATGGARRRLGTLKIAEFAAPAWSPDSQRVAYVSVAGEDRYSLRTIRADGSGGRSLAQSADEITPSWSPDGTRIAFVKLLAHYVRGVFVASADGTGVHEVSSSRGGVSAGEPAWSSDGLVLYSRSWFRDARGSDVFAVKPNGRVGQALTHPFPAGGSSGGARGLVGAHFTGEEQLPPTVALSFKRKTTFKRAIHEIATDGTRAVPTLAEDVAAVDDKQPALTVWNAATGRSARGPVPCPDTYGPGLVALAGKRLAWLCGEGGNTYYVEQLLTARIGDRRAKGVASVTGDPNEGGDDFASVLGSGTTISFSVHHDFGHPGTDPWLLLPHKAKKCPSAGDLGSSRAMCRRLGQGRGATTAVDGGRLTTIAGNSVQLLTLTGRVLRSLSFDERVVTARLRGNRLAVQHARTLDVFNVKTGGKILSTDMVTDGGTPPRLLDIQGDLVVYKTGGAIHLCLLVLGYDKALRIPGAAPELDAHLGPAGLFVSWNQMYAPRQGRIAFVPLRAINGQL